MLRHDVRRPPVQNMVNDGMPEKVTMMIAGHTTRAAFDRDHIVAPEDLKAATARWQSGTGTCSGTVGPPRLTAGVQLAKIQRRACSSVG